jgi:hypothetical protein
MLRDLDAQMPGLNTWLETKGFTFRQYFEVRAEQGVSICKVAQGSSFNLGYYGSYIYWLVEAVFAVGSAWVLPYLAAKAPFCARCSNWKKQETIAQMDPAWRKTVVEALQQGELLRLMEGAGHTGDEGVLLKMSSCDYCLDNSPVDVVVQHLSKNIKGQPQTEELAHVTYPGEVLRHLGRTAGA